MKHMHMTMAFITIALFIWQSFVVLTSKKSVSKPIKISSHIAYALLILSGVLVVMPLLSTNAPLQWVGAKIILLIAAISASIKAFRPTASIQQSRAGIFIASIAYVCILAFAYIKPGNFI